MRLLGQLAYAAASKRTFPQTGDVNAARQWLRANRNSGDDWESLEDAATKWPWLTELVVGGRRSVVEWR